MQLNLFKSKNKKWLFIGLFVMCFLVASLVVLFIRMEKEAPQVDLALDSATFGVERNLSMNLSDEKSGLKKVWVGVLKDGQETVLIEKEFPASGWLKKGSVKTFQPWWKPRAGIFSGPKKKRCSLN